VFKQKSGARTGQVQLAENIEGVTEERSRGDCRKLDNEALEMT
jgi:hypothetical protein